MHKYNTFARLCGHTVVILAWHSQNDVCVRFVDSQVWMKVCDSWLTEY